MGTEALPSTSAFFDDESLADSQEIELPNVRALYDLCTALRSRGLPEATTKTAEAYLQTLLSRDTFVAALPIDEALARVLDIVRWLQGCRYEPVIRVFKPTVEEHGYTVDGLVLESLHPDCAFLVDTTQMTLRRLGVHHQEFCHPILHCRFAEDGSFVGLEAGAQPDTQAMSSMHFELEEISPEKVERVLARLRERLAEARRVNEDFRKMLARVDAKLKAFAEATGRTAKDGFKIAEAADFLRWLRSDNFVFLGYRRYAVETDASGAIARISLADTPGLGLSRDAARSRYAEAKAGDAIPEVVRRRLAGRSRVIVDKTNAESPLHRPGKMDHIVVKNFDAEGRLTGCGVFLGLFTKKALRQPGADIPILRWKLKKVLRQARQSPGSHFGKGMSRAFSGLPTEFLFMARTNTIFKAVRTILVAQARGEVGLFAGSDEIGRALYVTLALPKQRHSEDLRAKIEDFLKSHIIANYSDNRVLYVGETVLLHFYLTSRRKKISTEHVEALREFLFNLTKSWEERLVDAMEEDDLKYARTTARVYSKAFPEAYRLATRPERTALDISNLEIVRETSQLRISLFRSDNDREGGAAQLIFYQQEPVALTDIIPVLGDLGLRVLSKIPTDVSFDDGSDLHIMSFTIVDPFFGLEDREEHLIELMQEAIRAVLSRQVPSDALNKLVVRGLSWAEVDLLRAYLDYWQQLHHPFTKDFIRDVLRTHHRASRILVGLFAARFDPALFDDGGAQPCDARRQRCGELETELAGYLGQVESLNEDKVLRTFANLIQCTLRTSFYRTDRGGHCIALKFDAPRIEAMREPRPRFEVYVSASHVEGVHIRGGAVARGGLRWSDRRDDYRDEVFGLMRTQMVKNAIIVPVGAKGGFIVRTKEPSRQQFHDAYVTFVRGLLDVTDNLVDGTPVPPPDVICFDEPDPYMVVAADKGTARMSDVANAVSKLYGFWLGDAFASGGSKGYDHKKEAITARGAWTCALTHLEEAGIDEATDPITVVGIGDMSGDVFGNGLLMSPRFRLLAAFDHRNIFIDPDPDPLVSFEERERLFKLQRSSWEDYDSSKISAGGGVYKRTAKSIELTPRVKALVGTLEKEINGERLIQLILKMPVDMIWNGGIGTYLKAGSEDHRDISDKANDAVRVDACDLRAKIFAEGGNLGASPRARIEFSRNGGRINGDFVDNSGGVDMSDHEVNLKILFQPLLKAGTMTDDERDALLVDVCGEVGAMVTRQNRLHSHLLSRLEQTAQSDFDEHLALIDFLREKTGLRPELIGLPTSRGSDDAPQLTRPELAVLMAHTKNFLYSELVESELCDTALVEPFLIHYFPARVRAEFPEAILSHQLRRQIAANRVANFLVDRAGILFYLRLREEMQATVAQATEAYLIASHIVGASRMRYLVEHGENRLTLGARIGVLLDLEAANYELVRWILTWKPRIEDGWRFAEEQKVLVEKIRAILPDVVSGPARNLYSSRRKDFVAFGLPESDAGRMADLPLLDRALDIAKISADRDASLERIAELYYALADKSGIEWAVKRCSSFLPGDEWDRIAFSNLCLDLLKQLRTLTHHYAGLADGEAVERFKTDNATRLPKIRTLKEDLSDRGTESFPPYYVLGKVILGLV